jgi:hypothetical protein
MAAFQSSACTIRVGNRDIEHQPGRVWLAGRASRAHDIIAMKSDEAPKPPILRVVGDDGHDRHVPWSRVVSLIWIGFMKVRREERASMARIRVDRDYGTD